MFLLLPFLFLLYPSFSQIHLTTTPTSSVLDENRNLTILFYNLASFDFESIVLNPPPQFSFRSMILCTTSILTNFECTYDSINRKIKFNASNFLSGPFYPSFSISVGNFKLISSTNVTDPFEIIYVRKSINTSAIATVHMDLAEFDGKLIIFST